MSPILLSCRDHNHNSASCHLDSFLISLLLFPFGRLRGLVPVVAIEFASSIIAAVLVTPVDVVRTRNREISAESALCKHHISRIKATWLRGRSHLSPRVMNDDFHSLDI